MTCKSRPIEPLGTQSFPALRYYPRSISFLLQHLYPGSWTACRFQRRQTGISNHLSATDGDFTCVGIENIGWGSCELAVVLAVGIGATTGVTHFPILVKSLSRNDAVGFTTKLRSIASRLTDHTKTGTNRVQVSQNLKTQNNDLFSTKSQLPDEPVLLLFYFRDVGVFLVEMNCSGSGAHALE